MVNEKDGLLLCDVVDVIFLPLITIISNGNRSSNPLPHDY